MATEDQEVALTLKSLFEASKDAEAAYHLAGQDVTAQELKKLLQSFENERARYAAELQSEIERRGSHATKEETIGGVLHQAWTELKSAATGGDDKGLFAECVRAEEEAQKKYEEALKQDLPADVQVLVRRQLAGIKDACDRARTLETTAS